MKRRQKNIIIIGAVIIVVLLLVVLIVNGVSNSETQNENNNETKLDLPKDLIEPIMGESYEVGYMELPENERQVLFTNYNEFKEYFEKYNENESLTRGADIRHILNTYNEESFKDKKVAVIYEPVNSSDIAVRYKKCKVKDGVADITLKIKTPTGEMATDKSGYFVIVDLTNDVTSINITRENAPR